ncbi:RnfH family protein [Candidatus Methylospira mobilis]|uniref:RnfH family protein n=1 Tax=Candidatus Methylospira mobilis TaxID=1808979 RepID=UPI0028E9B7CD|nr:RnfH family protein [Candidatus Methylospira mobilis]WNV04903.1 RnfH family protein [Candidatus Methylospira mobilis]
MLIEIAYAKPGRQRLLSLDVPAATTVQQAIEQSGIIVLFPEIDLNVNRVGIFSKPCKLDQILQAGDRVEIYRPLIADPKEARKKRLSSAKI